MGDGELSTARGDDVTNSALSRLGAFSRPVTGKCRLPAGPRRWRGWGSLVPSVDSEGCGPVTVSTFSASLAHPFLFLWLENNQLFSGLVIGA